MEKIVSFEPAYDKRNPDPNKNYGIGCVRIRFVLKGKNGAVQFLMSTGWYLPNVDKSSWSSSMREPQGWDLGYHSPVPRYDGQGSYDCEYLEGGKCYYDGSGIAAEPIMKQLIKEGDKAVWDALEEEYHSLFGYDEC
jgi:hypothetical protein